MLIRNKLISIALEWEERFGVAPRITSAISEYDAAMLIGCLEADYSKFMRGRTAVSKGYDFIFNNNRYQVKANRPSGKPGSKVTLVSKARNLEWDYLIWILYDQKYDIEEAWLWTHNRYKASLAQKNRISPNDMRKGTKIILKDYK